MSELFKERQNVSDTATGFDEIVPPPECKVVFYNDNFTTKDFVVDVLVKIFNKPKIEAEHIMESVHQLGSAVVGIYTYDIARSRVNMTTNLARKNGFPLRVEIE